MSSTRSSDSSSVTEAVRISAGRVEDWPVGDIRRIEGEQPVAVYNDDGFFRATADWCTHDRASLADGWFENGVVECPWHSAKFCVRTGRALSAPASVDLQCFEVAVEDGEVIVTLRTPR